VNTTTGQLTASIAHEMKQPIGAAVAAAQAGLRFLGRRSPELGKVRETLEAIVETGHRAVDVVDRIQALIKKAPPRKERLDINAAILAVVELTRAEAVKNWISVQMDLADDLPFIEGDRIQLQQVLLNLIVNAIEAMSAAGDGRRELLIELARRKAECSLRSETRVRGSRRRPSNAFSTRSTRQSRAVWGWDCRSVIRSLKHTADDCGQARTCRMGPCSNSPFLVIQTLHLEWMLLVRYVVRTKLAALAAARIQDRVGVDEQRVGVLLRDRAQGGPKIGLAPGLQAVRGLHVGDVELDPQARSSVLRQFEAVWASLTLCACYSLEDYLPRYRTEAAAITQAMPMGVSRQAAVYAGASVTAQRPI
jgi:hypothetical protein